MITLTFLVRIEFPENLSVLNVHLGDLPQYLLMFAAGTFACRHNWFRSVPGRSAAMWAVGALVMSIPLLAMLVIRRLSFSPSSDNRRGNCTSFH